ncbi:two-component system sensor histidine kinase YesM [Paenibacillus endophyticus]|uniref:histidine kinase n=1 Tax=Paenibacillus endophyticus TaxID=1294268 RepID=A0A7W5GB37_9BACL|nr:histidine kinase [Paenibacillus endophyticus]MBB3153969.1 two-component system sensor histidine kinase YesM [Paenibacillus endophyticus]
MQRRSIQFILTVSFTLFSIFIILIVSVLLFGRFSATAQDNAFRNSQQIVDQVSYNLENYVEVTSDLFNMMHHALGQSENVESDMMRQQLESMMSTRTDTVSLVLFDDKGQLLLDLPNVELKETLRISEEGWFRSAMDTAGHLSISLPHVQNLYKQQYRWVVSMSKSITVQHNGKQVNGVLLMDVNFSTIDELSERISLGKKGYVYMLDESAGNIVYHPQLELIYANLKQENVELALKHTYGSFIDETSEEAKMISVQTIGNVGWKVVGVSYMDEVMTTSWELNRSMSKLLIALVLIVFLLSSLVARRISRPIKRLELSMKSVERGDFDKAVSDEGPLEIKHLADRFNTMIGTIKQLMVRIVSEQESKRKYELEALQAQINPHFLYNTLNTVVRMVGMNKNEEVITTITALSKLFRISIGKGKSLIAIADEMEHARNYLIIQQMRFKNKFDYSFDLQDEALVHPTLKLIVQPLIENALVHGIEPSVDKGHIAVSVRLEGSEIVIRIKDDGLGMSEKQLSQIQAGTVVSSKGSGVGITNVQERIKLYFGDAYGLQFESELELGTTITIRFPALMPNQIDGGEQS